MINDNEGVGSYIDTIYNTYKKKKPPHVVAYLKKKYDQNPSPSKEELKEMAEATKLTFYQVYRWFSVKKSELNGKFSNKTVYELKKKFKRNKHPNEKEINKIACQLNLTKEQVQNWFQNRPHNKKIAHSKKDVDYLNIQFKMNRYPTLKDINKMVPNTSLTAKQIYKWFCKTRYLLKKNQIN